jgi:hypothetical protein
MDLTLLGIALALVVVGVLLIIIGERMKAPPTAIPEPILPIIVEMLKHLVGALNKMIAGPTNGDRVQGLGTVLVWAGGLVFIVWILTALGVTGGGGNKPPTGSPSPSAS